ncbi:peptidoglycan-binding protein [Kineosporia sp. R_H_3]|uniref:peptidoglycan-binding domain-containing protein n=1 Tax=Kineosporia sp. R_H_3 TaxID=1961848 RepID=UPI000B4A8A1D|nr:peptidoglycan-binding protein [Kineosporia sp. R_H_3]
MQPYVSAVSCDPRDKTGTTALGDLLRATYPGTSYGIARPCGTDPLRTSEHYEGRAVDWMVDGRDPVGAARARAVLTWLLATDAHGNRFANARRLGVMYVIWDGTIWGSYAATSGWRPYSTCAVHPERAWDTTCHRDHVHISLGWAGAQKRTSFWTGAVAPADYGPCRPADLNWAAPWAAPRTAVCARYPFVTAPAGASAQLARLVRYSGMQLSRPMTGPVVAAVQTVVGADADGSFGPMTESAVRAFQTAHGLPPTGVVGAATWREILAVARGAGGTPTPRPSPTPTPTPKVTPTPKPRPTAHPVLRPGSRGPQVRIVQKALKVRVDGVFGPRTKQAVMAFQRRHRLPVTGNVGPLTWKALKL